ncbi:hypothetical protein D3C76_912680 [compost metagenome]
MAILPVVQMQDQRVATFDILLIDLHHQHVVGDLIDESTIVVQLHYPVRLAQVAVRIIDVLDHEACVELAAHRIKVRPPQQVGHSSREFDHIISLCHIIQGLLLD